MLQRLSLSHFVIVRHAEIDFTAGFTALTGETGAGKSILLDALGLVLGQRADPSLIAQGAPRAQISAEFEPPQAVKAWLSEHGFEIPVAEPLLVRRVIEADGKSRGFIQGQSATVNQLRALGELLVDLHGQQASMALLKGTGQRDLLDGFVAQPAELQELGRVYAQWQHAEAELQRALAAGRELALEHDRLRWQFEELEAVKPQAGEWQALSEEQHRLAHAATLLQAAQGAVAALREDDASMVSVLGKVHHQIAQLTSIDPRLQEVVELLGTAHTHLDEAASSLSHYADRVDLDPQRLAWVEERMASLHSLSRKLRCEPEELVSLHAQLAQELQDLQAAQNIEALSEQVKRDQALYDKAAANLTRRRKAAAKALSDQASMILQSLSMGGTRLEIAIEPAQPAVHGKDAIEFRLAGHTRAAARPLAKVASGGELSRIGLAISVASAKSGQVPTLIFDEADAGVGGAVAQVIGDLMRQLGSDRQVLCVTHLPQVAARAHHQLQVRKIQDEQGISSEVRTLERSERIEELARMLGGVEITPITRRHARELLADAT
jgi:DNA repair protein RecN (Recombination protein N)